MIKEAKDAAQSLSTSLAPIQGSQLMDTSATPSPTSPAILTAKITEHSKYCVICTPLGQICLEGFAMSSDWDDDEEDQTKDNKKAHGLKSQPLKDFILGRSPSVNRKLLTHILTNVNTHTPTQIF